MPIHYEERGHVGLITIDRPERRGALNAEGYVELAQAWRIAAATPSVRVVVITGVGDSYCAGSDMREFIPNVTEHARGTSGASDAVARPGIDADGSFAVLRDVEFPKPIVAAVNGPCLASGMEMLLGTDIRLASPNAVFGIPEVRRGLFSGGGSTVRLPRQIPFAIAMEILLTGRHLTAAEALSCGLINRVVERAELLDRALEIADVIAANSPTAVQATKLSVLEGLRAGTVEAYAAEQRHAARVFASPDAKEGPQAFMEKRPPLWSNPAV